ncbi:NAD(P)H-dependent flavin oxidoreductase [Paludibacterium purpuratum]|uniref:Nitronate monooxygenase n=1 Tax=Paludibacterium purpuratum TaxID=1144873 RepID=A0A4R7BA96_9NEIS|nr:nitronate monooxygenase [Paludibacterium purpuratum]TDR80556.1 nitronate monooxygenase [Paludibacterium purpuratum]
MKHLDFCRQWQLSTPLIQAPMAGGATTPELVAAVCEAGALGAFAAAMLSPAQITAGIAAIRALTDRPFLVNLFVLETPTPTEDTLAHAQSMLADSYRAIGIDQTTPSKWCEDFSAQLDAVLAAKPAAISFAFGLAGAAVIERCHLAGIQVIGTATTVSEGLAWQADGADAVCAQGVEAGGHRGGLQTEEGGGMIGTLALVPQMVDALSIPVIAAGGVMDGRGIAACLVLGAAGVQMGTAFLCCPESGISTTWKQALLAAGDDATRITRVFSGRPARGLYNDFMASMARYERHVPPYPVQNALTGPMRQAAQRAGRADYLSLWAGQGVRLARGVPASELVEVLDREWRALLPSWG